MDKVKLKQQLELDEGRKARIYVDTVGKVSGGIGRNLTDRGFSEDEIDLMYENDVKLVMGFLDKRWPWWRGLDDTRQNVMVNLGFNLGEVRLAGFKNFLKAAQAGQYTIAASEMLDSLWAKQVGQRAQRLAVMMRTGSF